MNDSLTFGFVSLWMIVAAGCSSSNDAALAQTQTGATGGASSGSGGASANTGGSTVGGANHAGGSGASTGGGTGGGAANAGGTSSTGGTNAGGSSTSDGGVRTETLACLGGSSSADFAKSCIADRDCIVADHWAGCCHIEAIGLNASEKSAFDAFETTCGGAPPCGCCCDRTTTEDGKTVTAGGTVSVACVDGMCTTKTP